MTDLRSDLKVYTFTIGKAVHRVSAESAVDAMARVNDRLYKSGGLPAGFHGWMDAGPVDFFASFGAWD